ncbi:MAG: alkaline phosphatase family protein [Saprospiraceae bacterium]|nr:alkaline phosphatase family protein [Saprospiraceae bacterium]
MKKILALFFSLSAWFLHAQDMDRPKLMVGIVVDQMRFDYLERYYDKYGDGGFKRLLQQGFSFKNTHYNYVPTETAPGHSSIYTGATPSVHGIIGNSWYDRILNRNVENIEDPTVTLVGTEQPSTRGASPRNLRSETLTDQLKWGSNYQSKVISVSFKERGAILPGGHTPDGAYWLDTQTSPGYFVSSTYYMEQLPDWVTKFNQAGRGNTYLDETWNTLYPIDTYTESAPDDNHYESILQGKTSPTFPYDFKSMRKEYKNAGNEYQLLWLSPWGNTLLTDFALDAVNNEQLGTHPATDMLCISYSVTDVMGHTFGPQSVEVEDIYLRLDKDLEHLFNALDERVGKGEYVVFLTADHGAVPVVSELADHGIPSGVTPVNPYKDSLDHYLRNKYGNKPWILSFGHENVYLNRFLIHYTPDVELEEIQEDAAQFLSNLAAIRYALTAGELQEEEYTEGVRHLVQNGYYPERSGDILLAYDPGYIPGYGDQPDVHTIRGTVHGSAYNYDTHVPLLWYGKGIPHGSSVRQVHITDIASTFAMLLNLQIPSGASQQPLLELFDK